MLTKINTNDFAAYLERKLPFIIYNPSAFHSYIGLTPCEASHRITVTESNSRGTYIVRIHGLFLPSGQRDSSVGTERVYILRLENNKWECVARTEFDIPPTDEYASEKNKNTPAIDVAVISAVNEYCEKILDAKNA